MSKKILGNLSSAMTFQIQNKKASSVRKKKESQTSLKSKTSALQDTVKRMKPSHILGEYICKITKKWTKKSEQILQQRRSTKWQESI